MCREYQESHKRHTVQVTAYESNTQRRYAETLGCLAGVWMGRGMYRWIGGWISVVEWIALYEWDVQPRNTRLDRVDKSLTESVLEHFVQ